MKIKKGLFKKYARTVFLWLLIASVFCGIFVSVVEILQQESFNTSAGNLSFQLIPTIPGSGGKLFFSLGPLGELSWNASNRWIPLNIETEFLLNDTYTKIPSKEHFSDTPFLFGLRKLPWILLLSAFFIVKRILLRYRQFYKNRDSSKSIKGRKEFIRFTAFFLAPLFFFVSIGGLTFITFNISKLQSPSYSGPLKYAKNVQEVLKIAIKDYKTIEERVEQALLGLLRLQKQLSIRPETSLSNENIVRFLLVHGIKSHPVGMNMVKILAREYKVDAILDSGDLTSHGYKEELSIFFPSEKELEDLGVQYIIALGNHDSNEVAQILQNTSGVIVLDQYSKDLIEIKGIKILGNRDPASYDTPNLLYLGEESHASEEEQFQACEEMLSRYIETQPNIVITNESNQSECIEKEARSNNKPLLRIVGANEPKYSVDESIIIISVGTSGALGIVDSNENQPFGFGILELDKTTGQLIAIDLESYSIDSEGDSAQTLNLVKSLWYFN